MILSEKIQQAKNILKWISGLLGFKLLSLSGPLIVFCQTGKLIWNVFRMFKFLQALYLKQSHSCAENNNLWSYHALLVSQIFFFDLEAPFFLSFLMITIFLSPSVLFYNVHISYEQGDKCAQIFAPVYCCLW